jgi:hypothetical protein
MSQTRGADSLACALRSLPTSLPGPSGPVTHYEALGPRRRSLRCGLPGSGRSARRPRRVPSGRPIRFSSSRPMVVTHRTRECVVDSIQHWPIPFLSISRRRVGVWSTLGGCVAPPTSTMRPLFPRTASPPSCGATRIWGWCARRSSAACGPHNERPSRWRFRVTSVPRETINKGVQRVRVVGRAARSGDRVRCKRAVVEAYTGPQAC